MTTATSAARRPCRLRGVPMPMSDRIKRARLLNDGGIPAARAASPLDVLADLADRRRDAVELALHPRDPVLLRRLLVVGYGLLALELAIAIAHVVEPLHSRGSRSIIARKGARVRWATRTRAE